MDGLTSVQIEFLKILEGFLHGKMYQFPQDFTGLTELYQMSSVHKVTAAVYEQIYKDVLLKQNENLEIAQMFKKNTIHEVVLQAKKTEGFLQIYRTLNEQGVHPLVVKGIICRKLYEKPDYRISADEDILLRKEEFTRCDAILLSEGFRRESLDPEHLPHEISYLHPQSGVYIEVHFTLFPEASGAYGHLNREFQDVFAHSICESVQGTEIRTLCPTEHIFYLICHSFKHFLHSGVGIRQVCDMVMMAEYYGGQIDWKQIERRLKRLHMDSFWAGLAEIGRRWLGFDWEKASYRQSIQKADVGPEELLLDLLDSGIYGNSSGERKHSSNITLAAAEKGRKDTAASLKESLFPSVSYMRKKYHWLKRYPILLPAAWLVRLMKYLLQRSKKENSIPSELEIGMGRVELLKKYRIIQ